MGSNMNFKNFGDATPPLGDIGCGGLKPAGNSYSLAREPSIYSLTFDEFQNSMGGIGKDFGSMNMDELLKSIWSAEETQIMASSFGGSGGSGALNGNLQRQGSITLPRTLSQKTVDEVWRDLVKESDGDKEGSNVGGGSNVPQRQQTLGEMTLEEFLVKAGIVREDAQAQQTGRPASTANNNNANNLAFGFQQPNQNNGIFDNRVMAMNNSPLNLPSSLPLSIGGVRSSQQQVQQKPQQQPLYPKPAATLAFVQPMHLVSNTQLMSAGTRETNQTTVGIAEPTVNAALVRGRGLPGGGVGMANIGAGGVTVAAASPASHMSSDVISKASVETPTSVSPIPYMFSRRGKCSGALEKVIERRQRRMIKNRESAARSRARKQAYTLELEAEVAKLKEMNEELQRKQAEVIEMQKNELLEKMNRHWGNKRQCLRRTLTGPW